jgi:hypothetical protein
MIPQQMLVVRNVKITSSSWGDNAHTLNSLYGVNAASTNASQSSAGGSAGVSFGPFGGGGASVQSSNNQAAGQGSSWTASNALSNTGTHFDGTTLTIQGAQVIAFLSDIVPASPAIDDPALPKPKATSTSSTTVSVPASVAVPQPVAASTAVTA